MTPKEWADLAVQILRILISWPVVIGSLGLVFLLRHKEAISDLVKRLSELAFPGGSVAFAKPDQQSHSPTPTLEEVTRKVTGERDAAYQAAVGFAKWWWFEKVWNLIYKSQIAILEAIAPVATGSIRWMDLYNRFYLPVAAANPGFSAYPFPQYMAFLGSTAGFIAWDLSVDAQNPPVALTPLGREFLQYMASQGYVKEARIY